MQKHLHLDVVGGLSGDMFIGSMLDMFPELKSAMIDDLQSAAILNHVDFQQEKTLANGVSATTIDFVNNTNNPRPTHHYKHIKKRLTNSSLSQPILKRTLAIFDLLAAAEASVHGVAIDDVHFHEIADWDSQADIVAAASLIENTNAQSWSCSSLPMGSGAVQTEHGRLPVPAPATTELLKGFTLHDDQEAGERITPTGAAILAHLIKIPPLAMPAIASLPIDAPGTNKRPSGQLSASGTGCGKRRFKSVPNIVRIMAFSVSAENQASDNEHFLHDVVGMINFEIDDMTPEEIATGIERLRESTGVIDVSQHTRQGKKSRSQYSIQILCEPDKINLVSEACFLQTTTLGVRTTHTARTILKRHASTVTTHGTSVPIKRSQRPNGVSSTKVEADALTQYSTLVERRAVATQAEHLVSVVDD